MFEKAISEKYFYSKFSYSRTKEILLKELSRYISSEYDLISSLDSKLDNFTEISVAYISTVSFEFFEYCKFRIGGQYHKDRDCSQFMSTIHFAAIRWGLDHGFVTEEEFKEDQLAYNEAIRQIT